MEPQNGNGAPVSFSPFLKKKEILVVLLNATMQIRIKEELDCWWLLDYTARF